MIDRSMSQVDVCQACRIKSEVCEYTSATSEHVLRLCELCVPKVAKKSLSPIEWLNLASVHTNEIFELHDDFYSLHGETFSSPTHSCWRVDEFQRDVNRLLDIAIAWSGNLDTDEGRSLIRHIRNMPAERVKAEFDSRFEATQYPRVRSALMGGARCGILPKQDASRLARAISKSVRPDQLHGWVQLSMNSLPWSVVRDKFFEVVHSMPPAKRRWELVTLHHLARPATRQQRQDVCSRFLRSLPPIDQSKALAMYCDLVDWEDRPSVVNQLLSVPELNTQAVTSQIPMGVARSDEPFWIWGQICAVCEPEWGVGVFGRERGCWRIVCAAVDVARGRHPEAVFPCVEAALASHPQAAKQWARIEDDLQSAGLWCDS